MTTVTITAITSKNARRAAKKRALKAVRGSRNVPVVELNSRLGVCKRCDRRGLVGDEGICVGFRATENVLAPLVQRSTRCQAIADAKSGRTNG